MTKAIKTTILCLLALLSTTAVSGQESKKPRSFKPAPYAFIGLAGGATRTYTSADVDRKWAPMGAVSLGGYVNSWLGARLQANGWQWDEDFNYKDGTYNTKQYGGNADLLVNLTGLLFPSRNNFLNVVVLGGYGLHYAKFDTYQTSHLFPLNTKGNRWMRGERFGGQLDFNLHRNLSLVLEGGYHKVHDHTNDFMVEKWWPYLNAGINIKFGHKKLNVALPEPQPQPVVEEKQPEPAPLAEEKPQPAAPVAEPEPVKPEPQPVAPEPQPVVKAKEKTTENVFFTIGRYAIGTQQAPTVTAIADWAKRHPTATIDLKGYADRQTGNPTVNQAISEKRAASVKDALVKRGIDAARITTAAYGDTEQPFADNDKNRVVVAVSEEK